MKRKADKFNLKKLTIARIDGSYLRNIRGGDCIPTDPTFEEHMYSDSYCPTSEIP